MTQVIIKNRVDQTEQIEQFTYYIDALTFFFHWCAKHDYDFQTNWTGYTTTGLNDYQVQLIKPNI
jgi:hypothetical protein